MHRYMYSLKCNFLKWINTRVNKSKYKQQNDVITHSHDIIYIYVRFFLLYYSKGIFTDA